MHFKPVVAFRAPGDHPPPDLVVEFAARNGMSVVRAPSCATIIELVNRSILHEVSGSR